MARQARFVLPGRLHLIEQAGHNGGAIVRDEVDRRTWLEILRDAAAAHRVVVRAWGLAPDRFRLLVTPPDTDSIGRMMQTLGRRYVGAFNARHARSGTLWDGRFRACLVEEGEWSLAALCFVAGLGLDESGISSLPHHLGAAVDPAISDAESYWALGNTPFDRQAAFRRRIDHGLGEREAAALGRALRSGRPLGGPAFIAALERETGVRLVARPRGRPARRAAD